MKKSIIQIRMAAFMFIAVLVFNGCKGKDGAPGATGPTGATGNANVHTGTVTVSPGSWSLLQAGEYTTSYTDASLTDANNDGVEAFVSFSSGQWLPLPLTYVFFSGDQLLYGYQNGAVTFIYEYTSAPTSSMNFKVVVIPPGMRTNPNVNVKNYESLKKALNLKD
jgi:hypothetical protein